MEISNQLAGLICLLVGGLSGIVFALMLIRQNAIRKWLLTSGEILISRLNVIQDSYECYVQYRYFVQGHTYTNDKISQVSLITEDKNYVEKILVMYPVGKTVNVYYDPDKPSNSVLE